MLVEQRWTINIYRTVLYYMGKLEGKSQRKPTLSITLSPEIVGYVDRVKDQYMGQSGLAEAALVEFRAMEEMRCYRDKLMIVYEKLLENDVGRTFLEEMPSSKFIKIEALRKKGMACVELGDLDEAMKCFEQAKDLEGSAEGPATRKVIID